MTLLYLDGFDVGDYATKWQCGSVGSLAISATTPFGHGHSLHIAGNDFNAVLKRGITPSAQAIAGVNFRWDDTAAHGGFGTGETAIFQFSTDGGSSTQLAVVLTPAGTLKLYRGDIAGGAYTELAVGPAAQILSGAFYFIEAKVAIDGATGIGIIRVNEAEAINFTGDTLDSGASTAIDMVTLHKIGFGSVSPDTYFDDLYVCNGIDDGIGPANNDFLGLGRVQTLLPSGAGTDTDLTPVGSPDNWENVNDVPWSASDYNTSASPGDRDTYQLDDVSGDTVSVAGIQTVVIAQASDAAARIRAALRSGGSLYYDPAIALNGQPSDVSVVVRETDPDTDLAWTVSGVNALEAGVEITA